MGKNIYWEGGHCTYFVDGGTIRVGTPHNIAKSRGTKGRDMAHGNLIICSYWGGDTAQNPYDRWVGGCLVASFRKYYHFVDPS